MRKAFILAMIAVIFFASISYADSPLRKLGRGAANILTCPIEIVYRVGEANDESGPIAAFTWGILNGLYRTCVRGVVGVYEVVSFPIPMPTDYQPIITDPEFFLEEGVF